MLNVKHLKKTEDHLKITNMKLLRRRGFSPVTFNSDYLNIVVQSSGLHK